MVRDWVNWPELRNNELAIYYMDSPHTQILGDFEGTVIKVIDGDTIRVATDFRDFDTVVRFLGTNAPEMNEGGEEARSWLEDEILGEEVDIIIDTSQRVGKWGRILGTIISDGINMNEQSISQGWAVPFEKKDDGKIPDINKIFNLEQWLS